MNISQQDKEQLYQLLDEYFQKAAAKDQETYLLVAGTFNSTELQRQQVDAISNSFSTARLFLELKMDIIMLVNSNLDTP